MTGEDMIIEEAAKLLSRSRNDEHVELRRVFWIAGRCEHCGKPYTDAVREQRETCASCGNVAVNRSSIETKET